MCTETYNWMYKELDVWISFCFHSELLSQSSWGWRPRCDISPKISGHFQVLFVGLCLGKCERMQLRGPRGRWVTRLRKLFYWGTKHYLHISVLTAKCQSKPAPFKMLHVRNKQRNRICVAVHTNCMQLTLRAHVFPVCVTSLLHRQAADAAVLMCCRCSTSCEDSRRRAAVARVREIKNKR